MSKICAKCAKAVYPLEELKCLDKVWHKGCFRCWECNMTLNMKNYKGYDKKPYCSAHYPQTKATVVADTPELQRLTRNTEIQSQVKYHEEFEKKIKGSKIQISNDPETQRVKQLNSVVSQVEYKGIKEKTGNMESRRQSLPPTSEQRDRWPFASDSNQSNEPRSPLSDRNASTSVMYMAEGKVEAPRQKRIGSIADYDPVNENYGSLTQGYNPVSRMSQSQEWEETIPLSPSSPTTFPHGMKKVSEDEKTHVINKNSEELPNEVTGLESQNEEQKTKNEENETFSENVEKRKEENSSANYVENIAKKVDVSDKEDKEEIKMYLGIKESKLTTVERADDIDFTAKENHPSDNISDEVDMVKDSEVTEDDEHKKNYVASSEIVGGDEADLKLLENHPGDYSSSEVDLIIKEVTKSVDTEEDDVAKRSAVEEAGEANGSGTINHKDFLSSSSFMESKHEEASVSSPEPESNKGINKDAVQGKETSQEAEENKTSNEDKTDETKTKEQKSLKGTFVALYDYDAQDEDEVGLSEGDQIVDCELIDAGWMIGTIVHTGERGMLPSNYVEQVI